MHPVAFVRLAVGWAVFVALLLAGVLIAQHVV
jgi:hypothetical protein